MMRRLGVSFLAAIAGYVVGGFGGGWLVNTYSHSSDRSVEAAMAGAFVYGPAVACLAFILAFFIAGRSRPV